MRQFVSAVVAVFLSATMMSHAQSTQSLPINDNETRELWFVELSSPPTSDGTVVASLEREEGNFHAAATAAGIRYTESRHFRDLWNGLTVRATGREVSKLRAL